MPCVAGPHGTADPALIVIEISTSRPEPTIVALTAAAIPATATNSTVNNDHRNGSVCVEARSSFTAAHPRR